MERLNNAGGSSNWHQTCPKLQLKFKTSWNEHLEACPN